MLTLARRPGESILIYPSADVDPNMTVAELFKDGPLIIRSVLDPSKKQARLSVKAPEVLTVMREEVGRQRQRVRRCMKAA